MYRFTRRQPIEILLFVNRRRGSYDMKRTLILDPVLFCFLARTKGYLVFVTLAVFSSVGCKRKKFLRFESSQFEALNEVYLQNFLHRWVVNRETNLMMLINP